MRWRCHDCQNIFETQPVGRVTRYHTIDDRIDDIPELVDLIDCPICEEYTEALMVVSVVFEEKPCNDHEIGAERRK